MKLFWKYSNECQFSPDILVLKHLFFVCVCWALLEGRWGAEALLGVREQRAQCPLDIPPRSQGSPLILQGMDWTILEDRQEQCLNFWPEKHMMHHWW